MRKEDDEETQLRETDKELRELKKSGKLKYYVSCPASFLLLIWRIKLFERQIAPTFIF